jgi:hypothetical protein
LPIYSRRQSVRPAPRSTRGGPPTTGRSGRRERSSPRSCTLPLGSPVPSSTWRG